MSVRVLVVIFLAAGLTACASARRGGGEEGGVVNQGGATIISGVALEDGAGSVLNALEGKVPGFRVQRHSGECPQISLRSHVSFASVVNPHVYVDGTRATDTCILESLRAKDVRQVEVYPTGVTQRPGYSFHAHGLILIFMRSG